MTNPITRYTPGILDKTVTAHSDILAIVETTHGTPVFAAMPSPTGQ